MIHPLHRVPALCLATLLLCSAASAQFPRLISPNGLGPVPGGNTTGYPWGYGTIPSFKYQQVHDDVTGVARVMLGIAFRRKEVGGAYVAFSPTLSLQMSTGGVTSQISTNAFASNHGANIQTVIASRTFTFPAENQPTNDLPAPFTYRLMFDQPFIYAGQGSICWELLMTSNGYTGSTIQNLDLSQNNLARNVTYGIGCGGLSLSGSYTNPTLTQTISGAVPNVPAVLMIGVDNLSAFGTPLPLDLSALSAPSCSLYINPLAFVSLPSNASGVATLSTNVANMQPDFVLQFQALAPSASTPLGIVFSNALFSTPRMPQTVMRNWVSNTAATTGNLQKMFGLVTEFLQP